MKKQGCLLLSLLIPCVAFANPITITNSTISKLSVSVNGTCNRAFGVIKPVSSATADEKLLRQLCKNTSNNCVAELYASTSCQDKYVANFYFHTKNGLTGQGGTVPPYHLFMRKYGVTITQS